MENLASNVAAIYHSHSGPATSEVRGRVGHLGGHKIEVRGKDKRECGRTRGKRLHVEYTAVATMA